jgi:hypothetical protein
MRRPISGGEIWGVMKRWLSAIVPAVSPITAPGPANRIIMRSAHSEHVSGSSSRLDDGGLRWRRAGLLGASAPFSPPIRPASSSARPTSSKSAAKAGACDASPPSSSVLVRAESIFWEGAWEPIALRTTAAGAAMAKLTVGDFEDLQRQLLHTREVRICAMAPRGAMAGVERCS